MDGENNGKPHEQMDDLGGFTTPIFGNINILLYQTFKNFLNLKLSRYHLISLRKSWDSKVGRNDISTTRKRTPETKIGLLPEKERLVFQPPFFFKGAFSLLVAVECFVGKSPKYIPCN